MARQVTIQRTSGVTLRVTVEVLCHSRGFWAVNWLDVSALRGTRSAAILHAREVCGAMTDLGILSELIIRRRDGTIGERRTYGQDPRRSRGARSNHR